MAEFPTDETSTALDALDAAGYFRLFDFHANREPLRDGLVLYVTSRCNCRCAYCEADIASEASDLSFPVADAAFEFAGYAARHSPGRPVNVTFLGGEPTLRVDLLVRVIRRFRFAGIPALLTLCTNGMLGDEDLDRLIPYENLRWRVSMDIPDNRYAGLDYREGCDYARVERVVRALSAAGRKPRVRATVTRRTFPLMGEMAQKAEDMGARSITYTPMRLGYGRSVDLPGEQPDPDAYADRWLAVRREHPGVAVVDDYFDMLFGQNAVYCSNIFIMPDGMVLPTNGEAYAARRLRVGTVLSRDWPGMERRLNELKAGFLDEVETGCSGCIGQRVCGGGCRATAIYLGVPGPTRECEGLRRMIAAACERVDRLTAGQHGTARPELPPFIWFTDYAALKGSVQAAGVAAVHPVYG